MEAGIGPTAAKSSKLYRLRISWPKYGVAETSVNAFFGIRLPLFARVEIAAFCQELKMRIGVDQFRWTDPGDYHLTLLFLGRLLLAEIDGAIEFGKQVLRGMPEIPIALAALGGFPSADRARVLWIGDEPTEKLIACVSALAVSAEGQNDLTPHVTIGRARSRPLNLSALELHLTNKTNFEATAIELMASTGKEPGKKYETVACFELV